MAVPTKSTTGAAAAIQREQPSKGGPRVGVIMSTEVGLKAQYLNWRRYLTPELGIEPVWVVIDWWKSDGRLERLPVLPSSIKARIRAQLELREGLKKGPFDALILASAVALPGGNQLLDRQPYAILTDVTPTQLFSFGDLYGKHRTGLKAIDRKKHALWSERYRNAAALFPWTQWTANSMIEDYGADPSRVHVIPPGVDLERWQFETRSPDDGKVNILFVGGDFYRKGGDQLLNWAANTPARNWTLHLVTHDPVAASNDCVRVYNDMTPGDPKLIELYRQAHLFVLPSRGDCSPVSAMEALAAGLPVILTQTGATAEVVRDGDTGFLIPIGDEQALADRLEKLIANPELRFEMGQAARADAENRYDAARNIKMVISILRAAIGDSQFDASHAVVRNSG